MLHSAQQMNDRLMTKLLSLDLRRLSKLPDKQQDSFVTALGVYPACHSEALRRWEWSRRHRRSLDLSLNDCDEPPSVAERSLFLSAELSAGPFMRRLLASLQCLPLWLRVGLAGDTPATTGNLGCSELWLWVSGRIGWADGLTLREEGQ
jgi:hypothetical protein